jgi:hypothetical protein
MNELVLVFGILVGGALALAAPLYLHLRERLTLLAFGTLYITAACVAYGVNT